MARLPQPGGDSGQWGDILNSYLDVAHQTDGSLKNGSVTTNTIANGAVTPAKLSSSGQPSTGQALTYDGTEFAWSTLTSSGSVPDATPSVKGLVQLAGDLSGSSDAPVIAAAAVSSAKIATNAVTTVKITDANVTSAKLADGAVTTAKITDANVTTTKVADSAVTSAKIANDAITEPKLSASNTPANGQILSFNGTNFTWVNASAGGSGDPVMGGDLSGNASSAQIIAGAVGATELATNAVTTVKITDANVTTAKVADNAITEPKLSVSNSPATNQVLSWNGSALAWATPASGGGGSAWTATTVTGNHTATSGQFVIGDTTASGFTVTLPAAANGAYVTVKKLTNNVNAILVAPPSGQINAGSGTSNTISVNGYGMVADFIADGTTWHQVG